MLQQSLNGMDEKRGNKTIASIIFIIIGILLLIFQSYGLAFIALILGIALIVMAVAFFIQYQRSQRTLKVRLVACIVALVFGILLLIFRLQVAQFVLPFLIALGALVLAVINIAGAVSYRRLDQPVWWMPLIGGIIALVVAILIFCNLQATSNLVAVIIGVFLLIYGFLTLLEIGTVRSLDHKRF